MNATKKTNECSNSVGAQLKPRACGLVQIVWAVDWTVHGIDWMAQTSRMPPITSRVIKNGDGDEDGDGDGDGATRAVRVIVYGDGATRAGGEVMDGDGATCITKDGDGASCVTRDRVDYSDQDRVNLSCKTLDWTVLNFLLLIFYVWTFQTL